MLLVAWTGCAVSILVSCNTKAKVSDSRVTGGINKAQGEAGTTNQRYTPTPPLQPPATVSPTNPVTGPTPPFAVVKTTLPLADNWVNYQTRNVIHLKLDDGFLNDGDIVSVINETTSQALLVDFVVSGGLTLPTEGTGKAAVASFEVQFYPSSPRAAGWFAYGSNVVSISARSGGETGSQSEKTAQFTFELQDFDLLSVASAAFGSGPQVVGGLQAWFDPYAQPAKAVGGTTLRTGFFKIIND